MSKDKKELVWVEKKKIIELYRSTQFSQFMSGAFHNFINYLTALSLNLEQIKINQKNNSLNYVYLNQARVTLHKMNALITSTRHQLQGKDNPKTFSLDDEIKQTIEFLSYKARRANVKLSSMIKQKVSLYGSAIKFNQVITNLICNAIEACEETNQSSKEVLIGLDSIKNKIIVNVSDNGCGISGDINKVFKLFFSTKKRTDCGLGIGLSSTKDIVERDFQGKIEVKTGLKTNFIVSLPLKISA